MCQLGGAAMYLGALVVRYPSSNDVANLTDEEREDIRGDIMVLMYIRESHLGADSGYMSVLGIRCSVGHQHQQ